jgi:dihydroorotate dehydrogenase (NAD+) catalytic subunit
MVSLAVDLCGLKLRNPIMPAAGPTTRNAAALLEAAKNGAGGLVAKTVSLEPAEVPRPNMAKVKNSLLNAETWSELPLKRWLNEEYPKAKEAGLPLIASIGYKAEEIRELAPKVVKAGADALELSTHYLGHDPTPVVEAVKAAKESADVPVLAKLSPHVLDINKFAKAAEEAGADGLVAINTVGPCLSIDIETTMPLMGSANGYGWLSGPAIKPLAVRCVADIARTVEIPVVGVGGISSERDAIEFIMAGATAVQLCTAAITRGSGIYGKIADEMARFMRIKNYNSIDDFRGIALKHLPEEPIRTKAKVPEVMESKCTGCRLCERHCVFGAINVVGGVARIDPSKCTGCGLCVSVCPPRALRF